MDVLVEMGVELEVRCGRKSNFICRIRRDLNQVTTETINLSTKR